MREKKQINIEIGERIKNAREKGKITQEVMAERIDVSPQYVSDLERGVVGVSIATLKKICVVLGVSSDHILFGAELDSRYSPMTNRCRNLSDNQFALLCDIIDRYVTAVSLNN